MDGKCTHAPFCHNTNPGVSKDSREGGGNIARELKKLKARLLDSIIMWKVLHSFPHSQQDRSYF